MNKIRNYHFHMFLVLRIRLWVLQRGRMALVQENKILRMCRILEICKILRIDRILGI